MSNSLFNTKSLVTSAISVLALTVIGGSFSKVNAITLAGTVNVDTSTTLDVTWSGGPIFPGENVFFDLFPAGNWDYGIGVNGKGPVRGGLASIRHATAPHSGDSSSSNLANLAFDFNDLISSSGSTSQTVTHPGGLGHTDKYTLTWNYGAGSGGGLNVNLTGAHAVPWETDTLSLVGSTIVFGLGLFAKQKMAKAKTKN